MTGTEPIESEVKAMPHRSDIRPLTSGWARSISFVFIDTFRFIIRRQQAGYFPLIDACNRFGEKIGFTECPVSHDLRPTLGLPLPEIGIFRAL